MEITVETVSQGLQPCESTKNHPPRLKAFFVACRDTCEVVRRNVSYSLER